MTDLNFYNGKRVFVTGHTGFKGSWLCQILLQAGAIVTGYSLPASTEPALFNLAKLEQQITSVMGDVRDLEHLKAAYTAARPEIVFHLAAQPLVRESYLAPVYTYETNVMGTVNLLECVRVGQVPVQSVVIITTDKVYLNKEWEWGYREDEQLDGFDPYSNSKSCAELAVHSFKNSFFADASLAISTVRAGNVIGGGDFSSDRIIPDCVRAAVRNEHIIVRNPHSTRPYQHVLEPLMAYLLLAKKQYEDGTCAGWYNVGPEESDCVTTGRLVELFCAAWDGGTLWESRGDDGPHEAGFLKLDCSKFKRKLGWHPQWNIETAIQKTCEWTRLWISGGDIAKEMVRQIQIYMDGWS